MSLKKAIIMRESVVKGLVRRLLTLEAAESQAQDTVLGAAERICIKLHLHLSKRIGQDAFQTLLARALTLAAAEFPHLNTIRLESNGALVGLHRAAEARPQKAPPTLTQQDAVEGVVALIACLLELLFILIGEGLTVRLLHVVSPALTLPEIDGNGAIKGETNS